MYVVVVDILSSAGLSLDVAGSDFQLETDLADIVKGPTGKLDSFELKDDLNTTTSDLEWQLIMQNFPSQFGLYIIFDPSNYEGSIFTIHNGSDVFFDVSLFTSVNGSRVVSVTLPGLGTSFLEIPENVNFLNGSSYRRLGIRLFKYQLLAIVDCEIVSFVNLEQLPDPLPVGTTTVEALEEGAKVSCHAIRVVQESRGCDMGVVVKG